MTEAKPAEVPAKELTLSTGVTLRILSLNPFWMMDATAAIRKLYPPPNPPVDEVLDIAGNVTKAENIAHPAYIEAMRSYNRKVSDILFDWSIDDAVEVEIDFDRLNALRARYKLRGMEMPENDKLAYVTRVALSDINEVRKLQDLILSSIMPSEEVIQEKAESFKSVLPGAQRT